MNSNLIGIDTHERLPGMSSTSSRVRIVMSSSEIDFFTREGS